MNISLFLHALSDNYKGLGDDHCDLVVPRAPSCKLHRFNELCNNIRSKLVCCAIDQIVWCETYDLMVSFEG